MVRTWPKPQSIYNIQVFLGLTNFYKQFIKGFSKITISFTLIFKTITLSTSNCLGQFKHNENKINTNVGHRIDSSRIDDKNANLFNSIKKISFRAGFLTVKARLAFT